MSVQNRSNNANLAFILSGASFRNDQATILQDAGRSAVLAFGTVMAKIAATGKWVPLIDVALTTGAGLARGIYVGAEISAAALVAGDVVDVPILEGGACTVDTEQVVLENSLTLADVVEAATVQARTIRDDLARVGIFTEETVEISSYENA